MSIVGAGIKGHAGLAVAVVASFLIFEPSVVHAQRAGMPSASARPAVAAPSAARRVYSGTSRRAGSSATRSASGGGQRTTSPRRADASFGGGSGESFGGSEALQNLLNITPNSGFDYQFVNSINYDLAQKALIDPVTQLEIAQAARLLRLSGGGFSGGYILGGGGYYAPSESDEEQAQAQAPVAEGSDQQAAPASQTQPQVIVLQQAPQQNAQQGGGEQEEAAPIPDEGEFTLVLHSGREIQAVAFTHSNDRIVYITPEGGRASIASGDLDADETVRVNQERGTPLQLPL